MDDAGRDPHTGRPVDGDKERFALLSDEELEQELTVAAAAPDHMRFDRYQSLLAERERRRRPAGGAISPATEHHVAKALDSLHEEFAEVHDAKTVERIMEDSIARYAEAPLEAFVPTLAYRLARERLIAVARAAGNIPRDRPAILFVGLEGRGRSQMAAALAELRSGGKVFAHPVGTHIRVELDDTVVDVMGELGVDLHQAYPVPLTEDVLAGADVVVTLGRSVGVVEIPAQVRHEDWRVGDPVGADLDEVRRIRDELDSRVQALLAELLPPSAAGPTDV